MANYDASTTNNSKRSTRIFSDLNLNFTKNPATKDVARLTDIEAVKRSVRNLVLTNRFERPFHPEIGSSVRELLFENISPLTAVLLKDRIAEVINNFEPRAGLVDVNVNDQPDRNEYVVTVSFYVLNSPEPTDVTVYLQRLR
jgi:phage baseplate assembly protein W